MFVSVMHADQFEGTADRGVETPHPTWQQIEAAIGCDARGRLGCAAPGLFRFVALAMGSGLFLLVQGCDREKRETARNEGVTTQSIDAGRENISADTEDRQAFEALYARLLQFRDRPEVMVSSRPEDYNNCEAFREIVAGGATFLPFVIEKIRDGDFFLNQAMREITRVDVRKQYDDHADGQQYESKLWLRWWEENRNMQKQGQLGARPSHPLTD